MTKITIISVGKLSKEFTKIFLEYEKMINWSLTSCEIIYSKKLPANQIKQLEAKKILDHLDLKSYKIALDVKGRQMDSQEFAKLFQNFPKINFLIGGAFGLDQQILNTVDLTISLSKLTFPHQMAKIILTEQIYRSQTLNTGHPYHK